MGKYVDLLFKEGTNGLMVVSDEAKLLDTVKKIYKRDPGISVGGKVVKEVANKELSYVALLLTEDFYSGYEEEERRKIAKERCGLDIYSKWKHDELLDKLIEEIRIDDQSTEYKLLCSARRNVDNYLNLFQQTEEYLIKQITLLEKKKDSEDVKDKGELKQMIEEAKVQFKELKGWTKDLNEMFKLVKDLEIEYKKAKAKEGKKKISALETDHSLFERKF